METKSMNVNKYVAPEVENLEVAVEAGFAGSGGGMGGYDGGDGPIED